MTLLAVSTWSVPWIQISLLVLHLGFGPDYKSNWEKLIFNWKINKSASKLRNKQVIPRCWCRADGSVLLTLPPRWRPDVPWVPRQVDPVSSPGRPANSFVLVILQLVSSASLPILWVLTILLIILFCSSYPEVMASVAHFCYITPSPYLLKMISEAI